MFFLLFFRAEEESFSKKKTFKKMDFLLEFWWFRALILIFQVFFPYDKSVKHSHKIPTDLNLILIIFSLLI